MKRSMGRLTSPTIGWRPLPFDTQGAFLGMCIQEGLLDLENEKYVVIFYLLFGKGSASPPSCYYLCLGVSVHRGQILAAHPGAHLSPASLRLGEARVRNFPGVDEPLVGQGLIM